MRKREIKERYEQLEEDYGFLAMNYHEAKKRIAQLEQRLGEIADIAGGDEDKICKEVTREYLYSATERIDKLMTSPSKPSEFELIGVVMPIDGGGFAERGLQRNGLWFVRDTQSSAWGQDNHLMTAYRKMMDCKRTMERFNYGEFA